jgi:hypothetical protein
LVRIKGSEIAMAKIKILSREQRHEAGKSLRKKCLRKSHGKVTLGQGKRDIVALISRLELRSTTSARRLFLQ